MYFGLTNGTVLSVEIIFTKKRSDGMHGYYAWVSCLKARRVEGTDNGVVFKSADHTYWFWFPLVYWDRRSAKREEQARIFGYSRPVVEQFARLSCGHEVGLTGRCSGEIEAFAED